MCCPLHDLEDNALRSLGFQLWLEERRGVAKELGKEVVAGS
jgi:hypothetical protein